GPFVLALFVLAIQIAWSNLHGAYPLGVALPGVFLAASLPAVIGGTKGDNLARRRAVRHAAACLASGVGTFVQPVPQEALSYVWGVSSSASRRGIQEWLPTSLATDSGPVFVVALAAVATVLALSRYRLRREPLLLLVGLTLAGFTSQRFVLWWGLVLPWVMVRPTRSALRALAWQSRGTAASKLVKRLIGRRPDEEETRAAVG